MKLYIANCSQQIQDFVYRIPGSKVMKQEIPIGSQVRLAPDFTQEQLDIVISQHGRYGMISATEAGKRKEYAGLCYSVDKPVSIDRQQNAIETNVVVLTSKGEELRKAAAIQVSNQMQSETPGLKSLEMSIVEERKDGSKPDVASGVRVIPDKYRAEGGRSASPRRRTG